MDEKERQRLAIYQPDAHPWRDRFERVSWPLVGTLLFIGFILGAVCAFALSTTSAG